MLFRSKVGQIFEPSPGKSSSYKILGRQTILTSAGTFKDAYYLKGSSGDWYDGSLAVFDIWIAKGFGIVKISYHTTTNNSSDNDMTWELQSYNPNKPVAPFTIDKFPNYDGMTRTYEVFDYSRQIYDTIYAHVAESSTVAMWNYTNSDSSWQEVVSIEGTVAKFFYPDNMIEPFKSYQFPIELGNNWTTYPTGNSSTVLFATPLTIPAGRFFPCYAIETVYRNDSSVTQREIDWITPSVGSIQKTIINENLGIDENWRLIDYSNP